MILVDEQSRRAEVRAAGCCGAAREVALARLSLGCIVSFKHWLIVEGTRYGLSLGMLRGETHGSSFLGACPDTLVLPTSRCMAAFILRILFSFDGEQMGFLLLLLVAWSYRGCRLSLK